MQARLNYIIYICFLSFTAFIFLAATTSAASPKQQYTPKGITVSPALQQVSIPGDVKDEPITFAITNNEHTTQNLSLSVADFNTLDESGGLFFIGTNPTALQKKYGLAKWIT